LKRGTATMPIQVEWDNDEKRIIRWTFAERWTGQEFRDTIQKSNELMNAQDHTVSYIIDFSQAEGVPRKSSMKHETQSVKHPKIWGMSSLSAMVES
jgi:hypothetical protein